MLSDPPRKSRKAVTSAAVITPAPTSAGTSLYEEVAHGCEQVHRAIRIAGATDNSNDSRGCAAAVVAVEARKNNVWYVLSVRITVSVVIA
ncbi:MAG: hypothetical protein GY811_06845 [Myxococcales bacterium]|nr:hypothetical protein [Myxococcales bacterium]